jgi:hypothetical protein
MQWDELAATSHHQTAVAIRDHLAEGHVEEASIGLEELIEALSRSEKRALRSQLVRLMTHVIKWKSQPDARSRSWALTIWNARNEIADIREETPSLSRDVVLEMWDTCFRRAREGAEQETGSSCDVGRLTWEDVFDASYSIPEAS